MSGRRVSGFVRPSAHLEVKPHPHTPGAHRQHGPPWLMLKAFPSPFGAILQELGLPIFLPLQAIRALTIVLVII